MQDQHYQKMDVERFRRKTTDILKGYTKMHVLIPEDDKPQDVKFIEDLIFLTDPMLGLFEVTSTRKGIDPGYAIEKLETMKAQIDYTLDYFQRQARKK